MTIDLLKDALLHIAKSCAASRSQTRRIRWIKARAEIALEGREYRNEDVDLPKKVSDSQERLLRNRNLLRFGSLNAAQALRAGTNPAAVAAYLEALAQVPPGAPGPIPFPANR